MAYRLAELARIVEGEVQGDPERMIEGVRTLERAGPNHLSFVTHSRYRGHVASSGAGALLVAPETQLDRDLLVAQDPSYALARLLDLFHSPQRPEPGVHPTAVLGPGTEVDPSAHVGAYVVVEADSRVGPDAVLRPHVAVGRGCRIGRGAVLHPHVVVYDDAEIGARTVLHAGSVVGADGFGYTFHDGIHVKVPQVGRVVVEDDVEVGSNSTIDRATLEETRVGAGTKIDNLVQVGHNATVGRGCILCAQVGISGSATLGNGVVMGGQSGVGGHLTVGDGCQVAGKTSVFKSFEPRTTVAGTPAIPAGKWRRQVALLGRLGEMKRRLGELEKKVDAMGGGGEE